MRTLVKCVMALGVACLVSCSSSGGGDSSPGPAPAPPPSGDPQWDAVAAVVAKDCANCHNGTSHPALTPKATFLASPVKAKVSSGAMPPPPAVISDADKQVLLNYAQQ